VTQPVTPRYVVATPPAWWRAKYYRTHGSGMRGRPSANHGQFKRPVDSPDRPVAVEPISEPVTG
jgi:hypothetical protein